MLHWKKSCLKLYDWLYSSILSVVKIIALGFRHICHFCFPFLLILFSKVCNRYYLCKDDILNINTQLKPCIRASLVVQWLRIHLPMQGTRVQALVWEDPTCRRAAKPVHRNYWAYTLELASHNYWARVPQLLKPALLETMLPKREATAMRSPCTATKSSPSSQQLEKVHTQQQRPNTAKNKLKNKTKQKKLCIRSSQIQNQNPREK